MNRVALGVLTRVVLVLFTFFLVVVLAEIAMVAARTRFEHLPVVDVLRLGWEGTQDYFTNLVRGSLGEASSTSILGDRRRSMAEVLLDAYPKSMALIFLSVAIEGTLERVAEYEQPVFAWR